MAHDSSIFLDVLVDSYYFVIELKEFYQQCLDSEERELQCSLQNWEPTSKTFERLERLQDLQETCQDYQRHQYNIGLSIQSILDSSPELKDTENFLAAAKLLQEQKALQCANTIDPMKDQPGAGNPAPAAAEGAMASVESSEIPEAK